MGSSMVGWIRPAVVVVAGGIAGAMMLFTLSSPTPDARMTGPLCAGNVSNPAFDPWTGEPHGRVIELYVCPPATGGAHVVLSRVTYPPPPTMAGHRAIPFPMGFLVGSLLTIGFLMTRHLRGRYDDTEANDGLEAHQPNSTA